MSIRPVLGSRASIGGVLGSGRGGAAAAWYLAGGVSAANCVAAYTPKGAASLAASYDNNAAPGNGLADGTYDAAPGVAPTFAAATGWTFAGAQYLITGVIPANGWSAIVRFVSSGVTLNRYVLGSRSASDNDRFYIVPDGGTTAFWGYGTFFLTGTKISSGTLAITGDDCYINGSAVGFNGDITVTPTFGIYIGNANQAGLPTGNYFSGSIQAIAIYNVTLSAPQVAAVSAAMSLL